MSNVIKIIVAVLAVVFIAFMIWLLFFRPAPSVSDPAINQALSSEAQPTTIPSLLVPTAVVIAPPPTQVPQAAASVPLPNTSVASSNSAYDGTKIGELLLNGILYDVYSGTLDPSGKLILPDGGFVLWDGYFIGHRVQKRAWTTIETGAVVTWTPLGGLAVTFVAGASANISGFEGSLSSLPEGEFKFVTCFVDFSRSRPGNRVFGGNIVFDLTVK